MRQAIMTAPGTIEFREAPAPNPGPGEVLLRIRRIGVCGSDVHVFHGEHPFTSYPVVQGHEFSATVEAVGEGVSDLDPGRKVTATPQEVCGACPPCLRGDSHICDHLKVRGFQAPGVAQELFVCEQEKIVPLPDDFTFDQGALVEPTAVAVHAVGRAGDIAGKNILVVGAGPIGNLAAQVAGSLGAKVLIADVSDHRLQLATECGIPFVHNPTLAPLPEASHRAFGEAGFDLAFECAGVEAALGSCVREINKGGRIVAVAVYADNPRIDMSIIGDRELSVVGTLMYQKADYIKAVELIAAGDVVVDPLVTTHFPFERYREAYGFVEEKGAQSLKVMIDL